VFFLLQLFKPLGQLVFVAVAHCLLLDVEP
jgi:hypothetical protein